MATNNQIITIAPEIPGFSISLTEVGEDQKEMLLMEAGDLDMVALSDDAEKQRAANIASKCAGFLKSIEGERKGLKNPVLRVGEAIDEAAKKARAEVEKELARLKGLIGAYESEQLRKAQAARMEQIRAQEELAATRRAAETAATLLAEAEEHGGKEAIAAAQAEADRLEDAALQAAEAANAPTVLPAVTKGVSVIPKYTFEILDPVAAYDARPEWFELVPKTAVINSAINAPRAIHNVPGVRVFEDVQVRVRAVGQEAGKFLQ